MDKGVQFILGCFTLIANAVVTLVLSAAGTYGVCVALWRITGKEGYMQAGWVFAILAWPFAFVAGLFAINALSKRRSHLSDREPHGFPVGTRDRP